MATSVAYEVSVGREAGKPRILTYNSSIATDTPETERERSIIPGCSSVQDQAIRVACTRWGPVTGEAVDGAVLGLVDDHGGGYVVEVGDGTHLVPGDDSWSDGRGRA